MKRLAMSKAAAALLRGLVARGGDQGNRILLTEVRSTDWQSLTFIGERHRMRFRIQGPEGRALFERLTTGLEDAEFNVPGAIVADIAVEWSPDEGADGSIQFSVEALTIAE